MKRWFVPGFLAIIAVALALRLPQLTLRPLHNDEGVNAMKFRGLWMEHRYTYDPNEFHGPTLPYFTLPVAWLNPSRDFNNFTEGAFRLVPVCFGVALIVLLLLLTPDLGRAETLWASAFVALSPAMVFYSRYYIHEMLLVVFTALAAMAWWRHVKDGSVNWCLLAGTGLGLMWATKETFVFAVFSLALAAACATACSRWLGSSSSLSSGETPGGSGSFCCSPKSLVAMIAVAAGVGMLFFSSFFTNPAGVADAFKTYGPWLHHAQSTHAHPWNFYFERLFFYHKGGPIWSEGLIAGLAVVGIVAGLAGRWLGTANVMLVRVIVFYTLLMTTFYTVMSYKTPWCLLGFYHGVILVAGVGAAVLVRLCRPRWLKATLVVLLAVGAAHLGCQACLENFAIDKGGVPYCDTVKSPYTYSQTTPDIFRLMQTLDGLARVSPSGYGTIVEVMSPENYGPLPWYLRRFTHCGYWDKIPAEPFSPIMMVSTSLRAGFDERPARTHLMAGYFELRPNVFLELYVSVDLWAKYVKTLPPEKD